MKFPVVVSGVVSLIAVLVAVVAFTSQPADVAASDGSLLISAAESDYDLNSENTENVYQQQVVALWAIRDLDTIQARQNATLINSQIAVLDKQAKLQAWSQSTTVLLVLLIGLVGMWGAVFSRQLLNRNDEPQTSLSTDGDAA